jgi:hypothetical protein
MKKTLCPILLLLIVAGCSPLPVDSSPSLSSMIRIECMNEYNLKQTIVQQLKSIKMKDIEVQDNDSFLNIKAAWENKEIPLDKVIVVAEFIYKMPGVLDVRLEDYKGIIKQAF